MTRTFRNATIISVARIMTVALAISACTHGFFEMLQGYEPIGGYYFDSIGAELGLWGQDPAVTILHIYLLTGAMAFTFAIAAMVWALFFIERRHGALILLILFVIQTAFGGGIGYIPFYLVLVAWVTRIDKPLAGIAGLPEGLRDALAPLAKPLALVCAIIWIAALTESIAGFSAPAIGDQATFYSIWTGLLVVLILMNVAFVGAAARDLELRETS